ncbi:hypothetical protein BDY24DRAFT_404915 [Mrakia frigida]|uniref:uncharacterized protein n=1 Tax=Mrakia frigida TaxID=29902 RepID=UPI003FCC0B2B
MGDVASPNCPLIIGCSTRIVQDEEYNPPRLCLQCKYALVTKVTKQQWFEGCCVQLFPLSSKRVFRCSRCRWEVSEKDGFEPPVADHPGEHPEYLPQKMIKPEM